MSSGSAEKKLILKSVDGETFEVEETVAVASTTIKQMLELDCVHTVVPLLNVTSVILAKGIEYCKRHAEARSQKKDGEMWEDELRRWDLDFVDVDEETLIDLIMAANYLNIRSLIDLTTGAMAAYLRARKTGEGEGVALYSRGRRGDRCKESAREVK